MCRGWKVVGAQYTVLPNLAQLEEATKAGPGKIAFFDQLRRDFWIFKVKECFENVPSSFWWNLETFGQPGEKISVILHQRVCGIFHPEEGGPVRSSEPEERGHSSEEQRIPGSV